MPARRRSPPITISCIGRLRSQSWRARTNLGPVTPLKTGASSISTDFDQYARPLLWLTCPASKTNTERIWCAAEIAACVPPGPRADHSDVVNAIWRPFRHVLPPFRLAQSSARSRRHGPSMVVYRIFARRLKERRHSSALQRYLSQKLKF